MTRRDTSDLEQDEVLLSVPLSHNEDRYLRLRCLEVAVKTFDPDDEIDRIDLMNAAQSLYLYVTQGMIPNRPAEPPSLAQDDGSPEL